MTVRAREPQGGFTMVEVLVALVIMVIGLSGVMLMQMTTMRGNRDASRYTRCAHYAEEVMEDLRAKTIVAVEAGAGALTAQVVQAVTYRISYAVAPVPSQAELVVITTTCTFAEDGNDGEPRTARFEMLRTRQENL